MTRYADRTEVPAERTRAEIERTLQRYGATAFAYGWEASRAAIQFQASGRRVRILLPLPAANEYRFTHTAQHQRRTANAAAEAHAQACRQAWRALALVIKAKLEAVDSGIATFEDEFLAYIALPDGSTVGEQVRPRIADAYATGTMPALLPPGT